MTRREPTVEVVIDSEPSDEATFEVWRHHSGDRRVLIRGVEHRSREWWARQIAGVVTEAWASDVVLGGR